MLDELFLACLTRLPSTDERAAFARHRHDAKTRPAAFQDTLWALINTREFILNHCVPLLRNASSEVPDRSWHDTDCEGFYRRDFLKLGSGRPARPDACRDLLRLEARAETGRPQTSRGPKRSS